MAEAAISHHWDIAAPVIYYLANPNLPKRKQLKMKDIHPFYRKKKKSAKRKTFDRENWAMLKERIKGRMKKGKVKNSAGTLP